MQGSSTTSANWTCKDWINFTVPLYVKYIEILKKVEECYDQTIQPQVRNSIKSMLEALLSRIIECKLELIFFNNPLYDLVPGKVSIPYVFLDDYLIELKLEVNALNLPIPRFFIEDNSDEKQKLRITCEQRWVARYEDPNKVPQQDSSTKQALPEKDNVNFFFKTDMNAEDAIKIIQIFETSRQNLNRINSFMKSQKQKKKLENEEKKLYPEEELKKAL